jgi:hypothetical protein
MREQMIEGYESQLVSNKETHKQPGGVPASVCDVLKRTVKRRWRHLAEERIEDVTPVIPLGRCFWPLFKAERSEIDKLFQAKDVRRLITSLKDREDDDKVKVLDAAYCYAPTMAKRTRAQSHQEPGGPVMAVEECGSARRQSRTSVPRTLPTVCDGNAARDSVLIYWFLFRRIFKCHPIRVLMGRAELSVRR